MRKLLFLLLLVSGIASAQYTPTGSKTRWINGVGLSSTRDTSLFTSAADTNIVTTWNGNIYWKGTGYWNKIGHSTNVGAQIHDSLYAVYQLKAGTSAGARLVSNSGTVVGEWGLGGSANMDFHGFAGYDANRSASYTARSFTDKRYVDSIGALKQNIVYANVKDYGAVGNGTTDDRAAFVAAFASGLPVFVPQGKFYLSSTITLTDYQTIRGVGDSSIICLKTGNYPALTIGGSYIKISDLSIRGKGRGTATNYATLYPNQHGVYLLGQVGIAGARYNIDVSRCYFDSLGGAGIKIEANRGIFYQNMVSVYNCRATNSWAGYMTGTDGEYNTFNNCSASLCEYGFYNKGGNNNFIGGMSTYNKTLFYLKKGNNDGHNFCDGMTLNHAQDTGIWSDSLQVGFTFSNCAIYYANVVIYSSYGIRFDGCDVQIAQINISGSTGIVFNNTHWFTSPAFDPNFLGNASDVRFFGNIWTATPAAGIYNEVKNNLKVPVAASKMLKTDANSLVVEAVAGTDYQAPITNPITGTGTSGRIPKWNSSSTLNDGVIRDDGTNIGIGMAANSGGPNANWLSIGSTTASYGGGILYYLNGVQSGISYVEPGYLAHYGLTGIGYKGYVNGTRNWITVESTGEVKLPYSLVSTGFEASPVGWEFGKLYAPGGLSLNTTNYISVKIGGITYKLALVN